MKILIDVADDKAKSFKELIKVYPYVKAKPLSGIDAAILEEVMQIKQAFKNLEKVKTGKLKTRPVSELLNEL